MKEQVDRVVIGAGIYGLYAAWQLGLKGKTVRVLEYDAEPFKRASYVNQARVHNGYHYPRSMATALQSKKYYNRFHEDFGFCIHQKFDKIYAVANQFSWSNADQFQKFCRQANIKCDKIDASKYFKSKLCSNAFLTEETTYDAKILTAFFEEKISALQNVQTDYNTRIEEIENNGKYFVINRLNETGLETEYVLNATYASLNQIHKKAGFSSFPLKYELCEMILCNVSENIKNKGLTLMDGPFFSVMPFGRTGLHSLSSVSHTPHKTSLNNLPSFDCQTDEIECSSNQLENCNTCINKPRSSWPYMSRISQKYLAEDVNISFEKDIFAIKTILLQAEVDDSRPTIVKEMNNSPMFYSVLSGKINTIYDLDEILN